MDEHSECSMHLGYLSDTSVQFNENRRVINIEAPLVELFDCQKIFVSSCVNVMVKTLTRWRWLELHDDRLIVQHRSCEFKRKIHTEKSVTE